ncbi:Fe-S cluster assembly protein SufD [Wukongibacter baidiensis]|uniref:Fe-S cluster assembly protein SufD n=1 Tax=Wukongibacter baidiensis TaxID=1723361 RepID=UPI003D7F2B00
MFTIDLLNRLNKDQEKWVVDYRENKFSQFKELSIPNWKRIGFNDFSLPRFQEYNKAFLSIDKSALNGIFVENILDGLNDNAEIKNYLSLDVNYGVNKKFVALGESFYNSGILVHAKRNLKSESPIYINYAMDKDNPMVIDHNLIVAEEGSEITVVIDYSTDHENSTFHNGVTKIFVKDRAIVNVVKIQRMNRSSHHFDSNIAIVESNGQVNWITVELGSKIGASSFITNLKGDHSEGTLHSIYFGDGDTKLDLGYTMNHFGMRSNSSIDSRGALKDNAKKVFRGNLDFKQGSKRSKGSEKEYVTLLDPTVKSDSIPILFCSEDDVEGEHAASAGQISENQLVYLMSRGLSEKDAKKLIVEASFKLIIDKIPFEAIKSKISSHVLRRLSYE